MLSVFLGVALADKYKLVYQIALEEIIFIVCCFFFVNLKPIYGIAMLYFETCWKIIQSNKEEVFYLDGNGNKMNLKIVKYWDLIFVVILKPVYCEMGV